MKKRGLGRGLDALLGGAPPAATPPTEGKEGKEGQGRRRR